jgi:acyl-CoA:6-aminopenicillanic acid acyl transferase
MRLQGAMVFYDKLVVFLTALAVFASVQTGCTREKESSESASEDITQIEVKGISEWFGHINVVTVEGTPYEMGWAQGKLLYDEIIDVQNFITTLIPQRVIDGLVEDGLIEVLERDILPEHLEEIRGMWDALDRRMPWANLVIINVPLYILYNYLYTFMPPISPDPDLCSSFIAFGDATADGDLIHGRNLDWPDMLFPEKYPTLIVFKPETGNPFVSFTFPGQIGVLSGMNDKGITGSVHVAISTDNVFSGEPVLLTIRRVLQYAETTEQADDIISGVPHPHGGNIVVADGSGSGTVAEIAATRQALRKPDERQLLWSTNHYTVPELDELTAGGMPDEDSSYKRYRRIEQLLIQHYGKITPELGVSIMCDHIDPDTAEMLSPFDSKITVAKYNNMYGIVFRPATGDFWISMGAVPANAMKDFVGFNIHLLLGETDYTHPETILNPIVYHESYPQNEAE